MFKALTRIATALERIAAAQEEQVRLLAVDQQVQRRASELIQTSNTLVTASNDRAAWYHQESAVLKGRLDALTDKVRKMEIFQ